MKSKIKFPLVVIRSHRFEKKGIKVKLKKSESSCKIYFCWTGEKTNNSNLNTKS